MTSKSKINAMRANIAAHNDNLSVLFNTNNPKLSQNLFSLENKANKLATMYCNGDIEIDQWEKETDIILNKVDKLTNFRAQNIPIFCNGDARGYTLKVEDSYMRANKVKLYTDMGGYGILAPDFR